MKLLNFSFVNGFRHIFVWVDETNKENTRKLNINLNVVREAKNQDRIKFKFYLVTEEIKLNQKMHISNIL